MNADTSSNNTTNSPKNMTLSCINITINLLCLKMPMIKLSGWMVCLEIKSISWRAIVVELVSLFSRPMLLLLWGIRRRRKINLLGSLWSIRNQMGIYWGLGCRIKMLTRLVSQGFDLCFVFCFIFIYVFCFVLVNINSHYSTGHTESTEHAAPFLPGIEVLLFAPVPGGSHQCPSCPHFDSICSTI